MTAAELPLDARQMSGNYVLIASPPLGVIGPPPRTEVFASEADARRRFHRLRLEAGTERGWAQLTAVEGDVVRPLCWFGRSTPLRDDRAAGHRLGDRRRAGLETSRLMTPVRCCG
jgi:hypothetical protein